MLPKPTHPTSVRPKVQTLDGGCLIAPATEAAVELVEDAVVLVQVAQLRCIGHTM